MNKEEQTKFKPGDKVEVLGAGLHFSRGTVSHFDSAAKCWRVFSDGGQFPYYVDERHMALIDVVPKPTRKRLVEVVEGGKRFMRMT